MASVAYVVELSFVPLILPDLRSDLGLSVNDLALVFNAYATAVAIAVLVGGWMGDTFGAQRVFSLGVLLFVAGSLAVAMAPEQGPLVFGRVIQGIGGGLFSPLIPVLLARAAAPRPGRLLILWGSASGFVAGLAPLIAHHLLSSVGWSTVFSGWPASPCLPSCWQSPTPNLDQKRPSHVPRFVRHCCNPQKSGRCMVMCSAISEQSCFSCFCYRFSCRTPDTHRAAKLQCWRFSGSFSPWQGSCYAT